MNPTPTPAFLNARTLFRRLVPCRVWIISERMSILAFAGDDEALAVEAADMFRRMMRLDRWAQISALVEECACLFDVPGQTYAFGPEDAGVFEVVVTRTI